MADVTDAQQKRAEARQRRRKQDEPEPESEPESSPQAGSDGQDGQGVRQAAKLAAAIGAAGAAAAVAKALTSHGDEQKDEQEVEAPAPDDEPVGEETDQAQDAAESHEPKDAAAPEPQEDLDPERDEQPVQGAGAGDARRAIDRGREQLEDLLGRPVEKVSSLERTHDGWVLALEVVELQRIPETTDVLATYEMELDGDLNLRRYEQARRYHRGHTDNGDER
jgi:gas vesicle protein GvpO